jgi:hypothetical protein
MADVILIDTTLYALAFIGGSAVGAVALYLVLLFAPTPGE